MYKGLIHIFVEMDELLFRKRNGCKVASWCSIPYSFEWKNWVKGRMGNPGL